MTIPGSSVTMDEIGEHLAATTADAASTDLAAIKLEGDNVPAELRGKTVAELLRDREVLSQSVQIANNARLAAEAAAKAGATATPPAAPPLPPALPRLTKEQLAEKFETDPIEAVAYMQEIAIQDASQQFERRFGSLTHSAATTAEAEARKLYPDEFALFGDEIKTITNGVPDKNILANPEGWKLIVSTVRGKPDNFEKIIEVRAKKAAEAAARAAYDGQDGAAGTSFSTSTVRPISSAPSAGGDQGDFGLAADEKHVADVMGMSYKDYAHWKRIG